MLDVFDLLDRCISYAKGDETRDLEEREVGEREERRRRGAKSRLAAVFGGIFDLFRFTRFNSI